MKRISPRIECLLLVLVALTLATGIASTAPESDPPQKQMSTPLGGSLSPVNPEFIAWQKKVEKYGLEMYDEEGHALGHIPSPFDYSHLLVQEEVSGAEGTPASYDLRTYGYVTSVKDQNDCGSCWTFATYGSLESWLLMHPGQYWDFSENHLKNYHGLDWGPCDGGNAWISTAYLSRWSGPVLEADDPYHDSDDRPSPGGPCQKYLKNALWFYSDSDIKNALMTYGAMYISFYWHSSYYNSSDYTYYYSGSASTNHAVTLVGWDDNKVVTGAPDDGAWLAKNSWGTGWGDNGYFWISYYDTKAVSYAVAFCNAVPPSSYVANYQYDPLGLIFGRGWGSPYTTAWGANVFTATANEPLVAVGLYALADNTSYEIYVYDNFDGDDFSGLLGSVSGTAAQYGYHTITLPSPINLTIGNDFSIVVKFTTPGYYWPVPVEEPDPGYASGATAGVGESFDSLSGGSGTWYDIGDLYQANCCIKGLTFIDVVYVDVNATGANNGSSWTDAYNFLQDALSDAQADPNVRQIWVTEGTYKPDANTANPGGTADRYATFQLINEVGIYGGFPAGGGTWDQRDPAVYETVLSGDIGIIGNNSDNSYHVVTGSGTSVTAVLDGFTISGGYANYPSNPGGGGMYNNSGSPTVANCKFSGNRAFGDGGGMYNGNGSNTRVINCSFNSNSSTNNYGGGMANEVGSNPIVVNCMFVGNSADFGGGGMRNVDNSSPTVTNCIFSGNIESHYGGGGMSNWYYCSPTVTNCTFSGNSSVSYGGGIQNGNYGTLTVANCILWDNTAPNGSQIAVVDNSTISVSYCDVQGGQAAVYVAGGGTLNWGSGNKKTNPIFADAGLKLSHYSPCIDAGDNSSVPLDIADLDNDGNTAEQTPFDLDGRPRFADGNCCGDTVVDMGAFEFAYAYVGDFDGDCDVDYSDLGIFAVAWLTEPYDQFWNQQCDIALPRDQSIDWLDYAILAKNWLIKSISCLPFNSSFEEGTVSQLYYDPYTGLETLTWVPTGWTFYEEDACDTCGANYSYCNTADEDDPNDLNGNSYAKPDTAHYKTGSYSARFYARGDKCCSRYGGDEWMENAILISSKTVELPEYVSFWVFSENNIVPGGTRFGHQLVLYMCDADGCTRSVQCNIWRDYPDGTGNAYMHSCTGGELVTGEGPDANEIGADGEIWYRYTQQWPVERTNPPFYFKIEAQGHRWNWMGEDSLTHFWVDDADFTDEYGNALVVSADDGNFEDLCILCSDWLVSK